MKTFMATLLGLCMVGGSMACAAQQTTIPFRQLEKDASLSARASLPSNPAAMRADYAGPGESSSVEASTSEFVRPQPAYRPPRILSKSFLLLNGLHLGLAGLDVAMSQKCMANHHCHEGNPMMPSSMGGQLGVNFGLVGYGAVMSYELKKRDIRGWWVSPMVGAAAHAAGAGTGIANR